MALEYKNISGVKVYCDGNVRKKAAKQFMDEFTKTWESAQDMVQEEYGSCERKSTPANTQITDYGFLISVSHLEVRHSYGDYYESFYGYDAFDKALKKLVIDFSGLEYEGYIGYFLSDVYGGEVYQREISSEKLEEVDKKTYDFVGEVIGKVLATEKYCAKKSKATYSEFWTMLSEELWEPQNYTETIKSLYAYSQWIEKNDLDVAINSIIDIASKQCEEVKAELIELVNSLNNKKS